MVGIIGDADTGRSGGEWIMKSLKDLVSADALFSSYRNLGAGLSDWLSTIAFARPFVVIPTSPHHVPQVVQPTFPRD